MLHSSFSIEQVWWEKQHDQLINSIVNSQGAIILTLLWESKYPAGWIKEFSKLIAGIKAQCPGRPMILVINSWFKSRIAADNFVDLDHVVYLDFFLLLVYHQIIDMKRSSVCELWHPGTDKFLFLTGKPDRQNRMRLLWKFSQQNLMSQCCWSLFDQPDLVSLCQKYLPELDATQVQHFVEQHITSPDSVKPLLTHTGALHYNGIPYGNSVYQNCDFQVISETSFRYKAWITEKTWLAILNKRPFIMAGDKYTLKKLKRMGFRTFENYLAVPDYDSLHDPEQRLDAIVLNTKSWLKNIGQQQQAITQDVDHNAQRFEQLAKLNLQRCQEVIDQYSLQCPATELVPLYDGLEHARWKNWYQRVRDPAWPDCDNEEGFVNLPQWIQQELIEVYNYNPGERK